MAAVVHLVAGARPNFMKVAPLYKALQRERWCRLVLVHTGQHYDWEMSDVFLRDLGLPPPDLALGVGSGTHGEQTARILMAYEKELLAERPDWVVVVGDVNSTLACALAAAKLGIPVAHLEAGLRSWDRAMPEETNRVLTDHLANLLWTPSLDAGENLQREGIPSQRIERVGNIMMDAYEMLRPRIEEKRAADALGLSPRGYGVVTLHRPENVDHPERLTTIVGALAETARLAPLVFPVHPRTRARLESGGLGIRLESAPGVRLLPPLGYVSFMALVREAMFVITDSGGLQEETTYLGIPCLTLRAATERPVTVTQGTNRLISPEGLRPAVEQVLKGAWPRSRCPELWDGCTAGRAARSLAARVEASSDP